MSNGLSNIDPSPTPWKIITEPNGSHRLEDVAEQEIGYLWYEHDARLAVCAPQLFEALLKVDEMLKENVKPFVIHQFIQSVIS